MSFYSPIENVRRVREGLASLIGGRATDFGDADSQVIVVFEGDPDTSESGRILLFQQFFLNRLGIVPRIVGKVQACIKVFFFVGQEDAVLAATRDLIRTRDFTLLCEDLNISQVQFGSKIIYIGRQAR